MKTPGIRALEAAIIQMEAEVAEEEDFIKRAVENPESVDTQGKTLAYAIHKSIHHLVDNQDGIKYARKILAEYKSGSQRRYPGRDSQNISTT